LKRSDFSLITRRVSLYDPTQLADRIYRTARGLLDQLGEPGPFRLLGCGIAELSAADGADSAGDLLDPDAQRRTKAERATDKIRQRFGDKAIVKGRALR
ncbi:DinB/UmuC family translesion DNA polymerase, partial [Sulfitobacter sp.]